MATIQHKRYSTYGWNFQENDKYINVLQQGELGILLGHKDSQTGKISQITTNNSNLSLNAIIEIRLGTDKNQYFFDAKVIPTDYSIKFVSSLPSIGVENRLYIKTETNTIHYYNNGWIQLSGSSVDIQETLNNYYNKSDIDNKFYNKADIDNKFNNYYNKLDIDNIYSSLNSLLNTKADKKSLEDINTKINQLSSKTHIIGVGSLISRPNSANDGDIFIATDNSKEYIYVASQASWIELGDTTAETQRISALESDLNQSKTKFESDILDLKNNTITKSYLDAALNENKSQLETFKSETTQLISNTNNYIDSKYADAVSYTDTQVSNIKSETLAESTALIESIKLNLTDKIEENTAKFNNYYTKLELSEILNTQVNVALSEAFDSITEIGGYGANIDDNNI